MPTAFDRACKQAGELVANFKANESYYLSPQFSEAQTRKDFIDKFFIALGWDVNHDTQKNPYEQECAALDRQIDALVYELYGLSSEEIKIVEGEKEILVGQLLSEAAG